MRVSQLQRYILLSLLNIKGRSKRKHLLKFYEKKKNAPKTIDRQGIVTKSIERLIDKGLLIGYGRRTPKKWFIEEVQLTRKGKKETMKLLGEQQSLPFKNKK
ncbi:MAG: hypothetical protein WC693_01995 [Patescibacteria group bacterium]|jgi:hypothetical protein